MIDPTTKGSAAPDAIAAGGGLHTFEDLGERRDVSQPRDRAPLLMPGFPAPILTAARWAPIVAARKSRPHHP